MGLGLDIWSIMSDDASNFTGGTIDNLTVTGNTNLNNFTANTGYVNSFSAGTYYSGSTSLWDVITGYMVPPTTGLTYDSIGMAVSDETTAITSGTSKITIRLPYDFQITGATAYLVTTGSTSTVVDVNYNGSSLFTSAITIASSSYYTVATHLGATTALTEHSTISVDIDSAGSGAKGLKVWIEGYRLQTTLGSSSSGGPSTFVQNGINTFTGGTAQYPSVNITGASLNNLTVTGATSITTLSAGTYYSGSTNLSTIISNMISAGGGGSGTTFCSSPIGTIQAWHKSLTGTPILPDGWLECNGQTVTDPASPYNGIDLPNLNFVSTGVTGGYFLRGTTGSTGIFQNQAANIDWGDVVMNVGSGGAGGGLGRFVMTTSSAGFSNTYNPGAAGTIRNSSSDQDTRPHNMSVVWIIKIKNSSNATIDTGATSYFSAITVSQLSANTYYSGSTSFEDILGRYSLTSHTHAEFLTKANLSGATFSGNISAPAITATTFYSGSTDLSLLFAPITHNHTSIYDLVVACSDETTAITSGATKITFFSPRTFTLTAITATLTTTGSTTTTIDVNYNGSSVFSAPISITSGIHYSTSATTTTAISQFGKFTVDFDAAGTGAKGAKIMLNGYNTI